MTETKSYPNIAQSWGITGILILAMLLFMPINMMLNSLIGEEASMFVYYLFAVGVPFWIALYTKKEKVGIDAFNFNISNKRIIPWIIVATVALLFGIITPISALIPVPDFLMDALKNLSGEAGFFTFLLMVVAAPILEELIFRGIILDGLLKKYSPAKSIIVSSFLFGLVHLNPWQFVTGFVLGLFMGWIYHKTGSLSLAIIIHAAANLSGFLMRFSSVETSMDTTLSEMYGGLTNLILAIMGSIVGVFICIYMIHREFQVRKAVDVPVSKDF